MESGLNLWRKIIASPYARLMRLDHPKVYALIILPIIWVIMIYPKNWLETCSNIIIFCLGAIVMRSLGCIINDIWDRKIDAEVARTKNRPLAKGEVGLKQALILSTFLAVIALTLLFLLSKLAIIVGLVGGLLTIIYPVAKRFTYFAQVILGFTFNIGMLMARLNVSDTIGFVPLMLYMAAAFWTMGYDTLYGCQDMTDDKRIGVKSLSLLFGSRTPQMVWNLYKITAFIIAIAGLHAGLNLVFFICLAGATYLLYIQTERVDINDPLSCKKAFDNNIIFALLVLVGIVLGRFN